jgi:hypothetical protein
MFNTSSVQPRWVTEMSFNGITRLNFSRTSLADITALSVTTAMRCSRPTLPYVPWMRAAGLDDGGGREGEAGDEQEVFYPPRGGFVLHEIKIRGLVVADCVHHRRIRAVRDGFEPFGKWRKEFGRSQRPARAERAGASESVPRRDFWLLS